MDLLRGAYEGVSDGEELECGLRAPSPKRLRAAFPSESCYSSAAPPVRTSEASIPVAGRYVSKRERALLAASAPPSDPLPLPPDASPVAGSISTSALPDHITSALNGQKNDSFKSRGYPEKMSFQLKGHKSAVNSIHWSPTHAHLLASASMDQTICVWNVWNKDQPKARVLNYHKAAIKDVKWCPQGLSLLSCSYDCTVKLVDINKGMLVSTFEEKQAVASVKYHPKDCNLFLAGGSKGSLKLWDIRAAKVVHEYIRDLGPILDVEFNFDGQLFISSSDVSGSNLSENAIIVWDVRREVPLSNQVYAEAYTCPCIRYHPFESCFVAQSNGNYVAIFSSKPPFKLNRFMRYEKHSVSGFPIKCNFSLDGETLVSGSSNGQIYFYNYRSSYLLRTIKIDQQPCIDAVYHPVFPNVLASCSWSGDIAICE